MRVTISYPPIESEKGVPLLSQNRQFQFFSEPTYIYPCVPAYAATLLKQKGHEVIWDDGIAEEKSYEEWLKNLGKISPELVMIETKTPVVKKHWRKISDIKKVCDEAKVVLVGDHVTALPKESFENSKVDFVLTGGDYDFLLLNLVNWLEGRGKLEPGIWFKEKGKVKNTGRFQLNHDLNSLPFIDRDLTKWELYSEKNGNFKRIPGAYTYVGRDCWWHRCTFCSWTTLYNNYRARKPELLVEEVGHLIEKYGVKTIFDDTGTFPVGEWLRKFCNLMIERGYNNIDFSCNMRFGILSSEDYKSMKKAGFRMLLFGLESANQKTLDRVNKNLKTEDVVKSCKEAKKAGLEPHITIMFGYPWETREEAEKTLNLGRFLLKKKIADTFQATVVIPYPGTPLFEECKRKKLLKTLDWNRYDMREPIMKTPMEDKEIISMTRRVYNVAFDPEFIIRRILAIRSVRDMKFMLKAGKKVLGHIKDFS